MTQKIGMWTFIWLLIAHFQQCTFCRATELEIPSRIVNDAERADLLHLSFSVWHPAYSSKDIAGESPFLLYDAVLSSLEEFLAFDTNIHLVDAESAGTNHDVFSARLGEASQVTFLYANSTDVTQRSEYANYEIEWMDWEITYRILQVSEYLARQATEQGHNASDMLNMMAEQSLRDSLRNGDMDERLNLALGSTIAVMSTAQDAQANFEIAASDWNDVLDFSEEATILRYVGVALLWLVGCAFTWITRLAHIAQVADHVNKNKAQMKNNRLDTEGGVEYMLQMGRDESMKAMVGKSDTIKRTSAGHPPGLTNTPFVVRQYSLEDPMDLNYNTLFKSYEK